MCESQAFGNTKYFPSIHTDSVGFLLASLPHLAEGTSLENEVAVE